MVHILDSCVPYFGELGSRELVFETRADSVELKGLGVAHTRFIKSCKSQPDASSLASSQFTPRHR
jgi:hypothetical protein